MITPWDSVFVSYKSEFLMYIIENEKKNCSFMGTVDFYSTANLSGIYSEGTKKKRNNKDNKKKNIKTIRVFCNPDCSAPFFIDKRINKSFRII